MKAAGAANDAAFLSAQRVTFRYPGADAASRPALADVDIAVRTGRTLRLLGANGSGRSTLLTVLAGLAPSATGGSLSGVVRGSRHGAFVHADPYLNLSGARDTVRAELAFGLECRRAARTHMLDRVDAALHAFDLAPLAGRDPSTLSGGEAARLAIACQWILEPPVLLVDEVDAQLDAGGAAALESHAAAHTSAGGAVVRAGARLDGLAVSERAGGRVADAASDAVVLAEGRVACAGTLSDVAAHAASSEWGVVPLAGPRIDGLRIGERLGDGDGGDVGDVGTTGGQSIAALAPDGTAGLEVDGLVCGFEGALLPALDGITCHVAPGEVVAVVGPNGGGKSTLARAIAGLQVADEGTVRIAGREVGAPVGPARGVGLSVQRPERMLFRRTVADEVAIGLRWCRAEPSVATAAVAASLAACGLADRVADHPHDLLPSQRRWLALAAAIALRTPVLVLDEPTAGFDAFDLARFARLITLLRAAGRSVVWITHDHTLARVLAVRALRLVGGRIEASGWADDGIGGHAARG